ncbi:hypothetical protein CEUSTIGMA_g2406.t1 [Chlamydomonas eustigma]|uniref:DUF4110 domain-containing protein n=1 Tax=Chlamydomonas eustigma TaxID=1157962 RepID=A0A250WWR1_9CHLO|nr:hypothetical protein CEUSTIGMA_g2406.t1 [Chlamydomonas eustigma]|eukprot:GAX74960.1 hypothetical protein CEUSTIGMA_g2406.t1 [Chlamydomonas eustigma]
MGGGRDKRKKAKERKEGPIAGLGSIKTDKKTQLNELKKERRANKALAGDEDNIDALLLKCSLEDKARTVLTLETDSPAPSARVNASFIPYIAPKVNEIIMFGGECVDPLSGKVRVFNDLYRFNCDKEKWTKVLAPNCPTPRCAHQAVVHKSVMYLFGGEFTSPNQERFHHYKELWRLDMSTWEWDHIPQKGGSCPTARSGHRMVVHKGRAILFGGFYDNGKEVRYYNDLWVLTLDDSKWSVPALPQGGQAWPSPRSGCQLAVNGDLMFLYGGYSKVPDDEDKELEHGKVCDDMWVLDLTKFTWDRVKKSGMAPGLRASFSMITHKGRALLFGGVSDNEARGGEDLSSDFHNDLYQFNFEKRRWFAAEMRAPAKKTKSTAPEGTSADVPSEASTDLSSSKLENYKAGSMSDGLTSQMAALLESGRDKNSAIYKAVVKIQSQFRGYVVRKAYRTYKLGGVVSELLYSPAAYGIDMSIRNMPKPKGRINAQVAVVGNEAWMLGGIVEIGEQEITLDDMWTLDLAKMDGWELIKENTGGEEVFRRAAATAAAAAGGSSSDGEWATDNDDSSEDD